MTSIGQLKTMTPEQRAKAIAEHGQRGRLALAHLASFGIEKALKELATLQEILHELTKASDDLKLDPKPWYVDEIGDRGARITHAEFNQSRATDGLLYNLAKWEPRSGFAQRQEDYA